VVRVLWVDRWVSGAILLNRFESLVDGRRIMYIPELGMGG
jgi:hypothetical protein